MMDAVTETDRTAADSRLARLLADVRQRLIETGTRNRLVHAARFGKQGKAIDIVDERSEDAFRMLAREGKRMRFAHDPRATDKTAEDEPVLAELPLSGPVDGARYMDQLLQTRFGQDRLHKKLLGLSREAKTLEEEQGINALYIAFGFLRWTEDEASEVVRQAPLVLLPVSLIRNDRTSLYELVVRDEDILTNEPLKHRLRDDFAIRLPDIPESDDWLPSDYFATVQAAITPKPRWSIDVDGIQLGFFSFAKLLMVKDLEPENWADSGILDHPLLAGLLLDGFDVEPQDFPPGTRLDQIFAPADLIQVVDADASQTLVIETVRAGRNLVVQGPPGTGKSQTITNIIAAAAHDGKTVLFVAEKMAALNVVHDRLKKAGIQDICLELHSRSANKKLVLQELRRTLEGQPALPDQGDTAELTRLRDQLNRIGDVLHEPIGPTGFTAYQVLGTLIRLGEQGFEPSELEIEGVETWSRAAFDAAVQATAVLAAITGKAGPLLDHPFLGVGNLQTLPTDVQRLKPKLAALEAAALEAEARTDWAGQRLGIAEPTSSAAADIIAKIFLHIATLVPAAVPFATAIAAGDNGERARKLAEAGLAFRSQSKASETTFRSTALTAPVAHLRQALAAGHGFFGRLFSRAYRAGSAELGTLLTAPLPRPQPERMALLERLLELQTARERLAGQRQRGIEWLGALWQADDTDFQAMRDAATWIDALPGRESGYDPVLAIGMRQMEPVELRAIAADIVRLSAKATDTGAEVVRLLKVDIAAAFGPAVLDEVPFAALSERARRWLDQIDRLDEWAQLSLANAALRRLTGAALADSIAAGTLPAGQAMDTLRSLHAEALYRRFSKAQGWATRLTAPEKARWIEAFKTHESARRQMTARAIRADHLRQIPRGGMGAMGIVRGEIGKKRAHKPIRRLIREAGAVIQQLKPVFLMSPISVAQFLPPDSLDFDLLVIDEASQIRPEDAFGAIARARQIVVVGDNKQLPPTSFFDHVVSNEEDEPPEEADALPAPPLTAATEMESVLSLCEARGLPSRMLNWHYRSRHSSLIEVSNAAFYDNGLVLFPSPSATRETDGLVVRRVEGAYDRGGKRNNPIEAEAVARAVAAHAKERPERTLGVVTFSTAQRDQVTYWLDKLRQTDPALDDFMREGAREEFFVKNIENVQGDERDVIFISVGYGPRIAGNRLDSMAFGPVSSEGGERRLNVLFTRARFRTEVFVSFASGDIDLERSKSFGARMLKRFLDFGETGILSQSRPLDADPDSEFEVTVADAIRAMGYTVDAQVGSVGYRIDLAVHHPERAGQYMLAVECDGATYHSAVWARERDRQRQEVLEGLGWRFHRVWSTDWFHRRSEEMRRLKSALQDAANVEPAPNSAAILPAVEPPAEVSDETPIAPEPDRQLPDYVVADFAIELTGEPHEATIRQLAPILRQVVEIEGPVHQDEIGRRLASLFGRQKAGGRIAAVVADGLLHLERNDGDIREADGFWSTAAQDAAPPLRNRSRAPANLRKASLLPPAEIVAAIQVVLNENGAMPRGDIPRAVAFLFGFQRTGPEFRPAVEPVIDRLLASGDLVEESATAGQRLRWDRRPA